MNNISIGKYVKGGLSVRVDGNVGWSINRVVGAWVFIGVDS